MKFPRLFSNTINGQITRLVLLLMVLAFAVNLTTIYFFFDAAVDQSKFPPPPGAIITQIATLIRLADEQKTDSELAKFFETANKAGFIFTRLKPSDLSSMQEQNTELNQRRHLDDGPIRALFGQIDPARIIRGRGNEFIVRLRDGTGLEFPFPRRPRLMFPGFFVGPLAYTLIFVAML